MIGVVESARFYIIKTNFDNIIVAHLHILKSKICIKNYPSNLQIAEHFERPTLHV
jgi:hypothetical protein